MQLKTIVIAGFVTSFFVAVLTVAIVGYCVSNCSEIVQEAAQTAGKASKVYEEAKEK